MTKVQTKFQPEDVQLIIAGLAEISVNLKGVLRKYTAPPVLSGGWGNSDVVLTACIPGAIVGITCDSMIHGHGFGTDKSESHLSSTGMIHYVRNWAVNDIQYTMQDGEIGLTDGCADVLSHPSISKLIVSITMSLLELEFIRLRQELSGDDKRD